MFFRKPSHYKRTPRAPRRFRLEALELRNCLSTSPLSLGVTAETAGYPNVQVMGTVYEPPPGCQVTLSGPVNASVPVDSSGNFSYFGPAGGLGTITAAATDSAGDSAQASSSIMHSPPDVDALQAMPTGRGKQVDISGSVMADNLADLTVNFSGTAGLQTTSVTTDAYGNFNLLTTASSLGSISAIVTDDWGVQSGPTTMQLSDNAPQIESLSVTATGRGKQVEVTGNVMATSPGGLAVTFGGRAGVSGSATTDPYGNFDLLATASQLGTLTAVTQDSWGVSSAIATTTLTVQPPTINSLTAVNLGNGEWEFEGSVSGPDVTDDTVQLSGLASASATPDASGNFSVIVQIGTNPSGSEYAAATDIWGQTSSQTEYTFLT